MVRSRVAGCLIIARLLELALAIDGRVVRVETVPNTSEKRFLRSKLHLGSLLIVKLTQFVQGLADFRRALAATLHMVVQNIQSLGGI